MRYSNRLNIACNTASRNDVMLFPLLVACFTDICGHHRMGVSIPPGKTSRLQGGCVYTLSHCQHRYAAASKDASVFIQQSACSGQQLDQICPEDGVLLLLCSCLWSVWRFCQCKQFLVLSLAMATLLKGCVLALLCFVSAMPALVSPCPQMTHAAIARSL